MKAFSSSTRARFARPWLAGVALVSVTALAIAGCDASDLAGLVGSSCTPDTCDYVVNTLVVVNNGSGVTLLADQGDNTLFSSTGGTWSQVGAETASRRAPLLASPAFATDKTLFLGNSVSTDGGATWAETCAIVHAISPSFATDKTVYGIDAAVANGAVADSTPGTSTPNAGCPSSTGSYFVSKDAGQTWAAAQGPSGAGDPDQFVISPTFATDKTLFATFFVSSAETLYRSTNAGTSWTKVLDGKQNVVAISPNYSQDKTLIAVSADKAQRSTNGGSSWQDITSPVDAAQIADVVFSPGFGNDSTVLLTSAAVDTGSSATHGTFASTDGGVTWEAAGTVTQRGSNRPSLVFSPNYASDKTLYTPSLDSGKGPAKSTDLGKTWTAFADGLTLIQPAG